MTYFVIIFEVVSLINHTNTAPNISYGDRIEIVQKYNETGLQRCVYICELHSSLDYLPVVCTQK